MCDDARMTTRGCHVQLLLIISMVTAASFATATRAEAKTDPLTAQITATIDDQFAGFRDTKRTSTSTPKTRCSR
jgi:hypothetical protein